MRVFLCLGMMVYLWCMGIGFANENAVESKAPLPDSSLVNKTELKKLSRLGMTMNQLQSLWGSPLSGSEDEFTWEDVGGIRLELVFSPLYSSRGGVEINPNRSRCRSMRFRYVEGSLKLNDEEALKIAQALLPGFSWKRMISPEELADAREKAAQPASDPFEPDPKPLEVVIYSTTDQGKTYELWCSSQGGYEYELRFRENPKLIKIDTNQL